MIIDGRAESALPFAQLRQPQVVDTTVEGGQDLVTVADKSCKHLVGTNRLDDLASAKR